MLRKHAESRTGSSAPEPLRAGDVLLTGDAAAFGRIDPPQAASRTGNQQAANPCATGSESDRALDALGDAVVLLDARLTVLEINAALAELLGSGAHALSQRPLESCFAKLLTQQQLEELERLSRGEIASVRFAALLHRPDGEPLPAVVWLQQVGAPIGFVLGVVKPAADPREQPAEQASAERDFLTGLPGRSALEAELRRVERSTESAASHLAVLFIDLDRFKQVNDSRGHRAGDQVLQHVAQRLAKSVRPGDFVARYGGDEFVALVHQLRDAQEVAGIAERIRAELSLPIRVPGGEPGAEIIVTASIGVALSQGPFAAADLLDQADSDMYRAKREYYRRKPR